MLKPAAETMSLNFANAPKKFIKRDGAPFKFEQFKLEMVLDELGLEDSEIKAAVLSKVYAKLAAYTVDAVQVHAAFRASLNELGYLNEAKEYEAKRQEDEADWRAETDTKQRLAKLVDKDPSIVHENANKDSDVFATQRDLTAGTVGKTVGLTLMPQHIAKAHLRGDIHWHDLDYTPLSPMSNCCLIDFDCMLNHGFKIGNAFVEVPNSIRVATSQVAQIITSVASSQYGGCSFDRCDEVLAPFAEKDYKKHLEEGREFIDEEDKVKAFAKKRTQKDIYDAMQSLEYEINTMFSSQGQTPFTTLGFGLGTNWIEREIQKDILQVRIEGLGREHRTAIFPKLVFSLKKGLNLHPGDPNYDIKKLALECATKRMYPDVLNYDKIIDITGSFKAPMGCRSFLQGWKDEQGLEVNSGRMNLGVVTLNLPRIAMESQGDMDRFWEIFNDRLELGRQACEYKAKKVTEAKPVNAPTLYEYGAFGQGVGDDGDVNDFFKNGRATVSLGYIGLYEVGTVFYGPDWEKDPEAKAFSEDMVRRNSAGGLSYGWNWLDQGVGIDGIYDLASGSRVSRFADLSKEVGDNMDFIYLDVWGNLTSSGSEDSWETRKMSKMINDNGWRMTTEWEIGRAHV